MRKISEHPGNDPMPHHDVHPTSAYAKLVQVFANTRQSHIHSNLYGMTHLGNKESDTISKYCIIINMTFGPKCCII